MTNRDEKKPAPQGGRGDIGTADEDCVTNPPLKEKYQRHSKYAGDRDEDVDAMSEDSFPASDPPSYSGSTSGAGNSETSANAGAKKSSRISETRPHKPAGSGDKSVKELAKQKWPGSDADGETG